MRFAAHRDCPKCGVWAFHWLEKPKPKPEPSEWDEYMAEYEAWKTDRGVEIVAWGGNLVATTKTAPKPRRMLDESTFEVMRVCTSCSYRWGET